MNDILAFLKSIDVDKLTYNEIYKRYQNRGGRVPKNTFRKTIDHLVFCGALTYEPVYLYDGVCGRRFLFTKDTQRFNDVYTIHT